MKSVLSYWSNAFTFSGRLQRRDYWIQILLNALTMVAVLFVIGILSGLSGSGTIFSNVIVATYVLILLANILPSLSALVRRLRDSMGTGWLALLIFVPFIGGLLIFIFSLLPSKQE